MNAARFLKYGVGSLLCLVVITPAGVAQSATPSGSGHAAPASVVPGAPVPLVITTEGGAPVVSKDDYVQGSMLLGGATLPLEIKGRGNSTWNWPKKPYKIKLEEPAALLGMPANEAWVLLANYADRTALRTHLAMALGSATRLDWTPRTRFVDVVLNGVPLGLYVLTDQVEQGKNRVRLPDGGYLLEIDQRFRRSGDPGFRSDRGTPVSYKDPDELTLEERQRVRGAVNRFEKVLYGKDFAYPQHGYAAYIDIDSVIDWYLVEELFFNQDSNFRSSVNMSWVPRKGFSMGPLWDFDLSAGSHWRAPVAPAGYYTRYGQPNWVGRMLQDPSFSTAVKSRWAELRPTVDAIIAQIPAAADAILPSALNNWAIWPTTDIDVLAGSIHADTFTGEVSYLQDWLAQRAGWMSADEAIFGRAAWAVKERQRVVNVPVRILGSQSRPVEVGYAWTSGSATPGEDFNMVDGTLTFAPGETVKTFPVTLVGDRVRERAETIRLTLTGTAAGPRLGDPSLVTLTIRRSDPPR
jgi:hypothetical protein